MKKNNQNNNLRKTDYLCLPFSTSKNKAIRKTFEKSNYKIAFRTRNNAFDLINRYSTINNNNTNDFEKCGIYKIKCSDCPKYYIGQTGRSFKRRFNEHIQAIKSNNQTTQKSAFADHVLKTDHKYKNHEENMSIIEVIQKGNRMNILEEFHIYKNYKTNKEDLLNTMQIQENNFIFDKIINLKKNQLHP